MLCFPVLLSYTQIYTSFPFYKMPTPYFPNTHPNVTFVLMSFSKHSTIEKKHTQNKRKHISDQAKPFVRTVLPIACGASHTAWQIAISEVQRQAIYADPKWNNGNPSPDDPPLAGLSVARQIGMVSYRTSMGYEKKFGRKVRNAATDDDAPPPSYGSQAPWEVKSYLIYQGTKFLSRFDPVTYIKLTEQMDTHDVGRNRGGKEKALRNVHIPALVLGIDSDVLYPLHEQKELVSLFPNAELKVIHSEAGHDGFLLEQDQVASYITGFLEAHD
mmetsp:Transcript_14810/g.22057  ORF Transcript_14810/g.22057 Transcript_14810/m.22057 type:complete len:272 (-) Transcript_14810:462-1277(-)